MRIDCIIGKSFGTYVALQLSRDLKPGQQILIGLPMAMPVVGPQLMQDLSSTNVPTWLVVNDEDPVVGEYDFGALANGNIHPPYIKNRNDHTYVEFSFYADLLNSL
ncbi:MAG TPA: hypothetical protein VK694_01420 [Verrucomicrobiae bacterium]|nr:hypothetical protein [Verrucomicrobiae bacterium]